MSLAFSVSSLACVLRHSEPETQGWECLTYATACGRHHRQNQAVNDSVLFWRIVKCSMEGTLAIE